jgi:ribosomal protein S12 methylthiotransferase
LSRMKRQITQQETRQLIQDCRSIVPDLTLRTTTLVGFPGETKKEFEDLVNFANEIQFDRLGVFQYSHEEDTSAHLLKDNVSKKEKERRANELMEVQREISTQKNQLKIGKTLKVLFDRKEGDYFIGRTEGDSPEVDNEVLVEANEQFARVGDFAMVHINDANEFDLFGDIVSS